MPLSCTNAPLRTLISSTRQWNPGDEFIRMGVEYLISQSFSGKVNYSLWDRNPDNFINRWADARMRQNLISNSLIEPSLDFHDLVVFAGSPEWLGACHERIFAELHRTKVPLLALGVGSGGNVQLSELEKEVLLACNTLVVTRSMELRECLSEQVGVAGFSVHDLPCPAFFSYDCLINSFGPAKSSHENKDRYALIVQSASVLNQSISKDLEGELFKFLTTMSKAQSNQVDIICFYLDEYFLFQRKFGNKFRVIYSYDPLSLMLTISSYKKILSTRLHGAVAAISSGVPAALIQKNNYRVESTRRMFAENLPDISVVNAWEWLTSEQDVGANLSKFKVDVLNKYLSILTPFFNENFIKNANV